MKTLQEARVTPADEKKWRDNHKALIKSRPTGRWRPLPSGGGALYPLKRRMPSSARDKFSSRRKKLDHIKSYNNSVMLGLGRLAGAGSRGYFFMAPRNVASAVNRETGMEVWLVGYEQGSHTKGEEPPAPIWFVKDDRSGIMFESVSLTESIRDDLAYLSERKGSVFPDGRWPIGDKKHGKLALTYILAGRGESEDWPAVYKAVMAKYGDDPEFQELIGKVKRKLRM